MSSKPAFSAAAAILLAALGPAPGEEPAGQTISAGPDKIVCGDEPAGLYGEIPDPKKTGATVRWSQVSGPSRAEIERADAPRAIARGLAEGVYEFRVEAVLPDGTRLSDEKRVEVGPPLAGMAEFAPDHPAIAYTGRRLAKGPGQVDIGFSGASARVQFSGSGPVAAKLGAGWGPPAFVWAVLDGDPANARVIEVDGRTTYLLFRDLPPGPHRVELIRLSGAWSGSVEFKGFLLPPGAEAIPPEARPPRRVEFQGDSITEGTYWPEPPGVNPVLAYAMRAAAMLGAEAHLVAQSGIGLVRGSAAPRTLPGLIDRAVPMDAKSAWDHGAWQPHAVVTNIGQNDLWTWPKDHPPDEFIAAYVELLRANRKNNPSAWLVAAIGPMDASSPKSPIPQWIEEAVSRYQGETGDRRVSFFLIPFIERKGHPNPEEAENAARQLADFLEGLPGALPPRS